MANETEENLESFFQTQSVGSNTSVPLNCESEEVINALPEFEFSEETIASDFTQKGISIYSPPTSDGKFPCGMTKFEYSAIRYYTGHGYGAINTALRSQNKDTYEKYQMLSKVTNRGLYKIKPYIGFVRRGTYLPEAEVINHSLVGRIVKYFAFTSTSSSAGWSANNRFIIYSKTCRNVAPISLHPNENEVLCPAGLEFRILRLKTNGSSNISQNVFIMEEVDNEELFIDP
ncbi:MAG: ADP-ribosyltransferase [Bdellovibrionaceae bacterium]|nr:ADP-ribosyltransferase [Pseudobdellovibrionaceae bacterium]NUM60372.1 hypothetical protein [Pseudobdellovibrionaceae bacterium]